jgi:hypothetical protein
MTSAILLFLSLACTPEPPSVSSIEPASGPTGTTVTVTGSHFGAGTTARLGGRELGDLTVTSETSLTGTVPAETAPGPADLVVKSPGGTSALPKAFTVAAPQPKGPPCQSKDKRMTSIASTADVIKIDVYPEGSKEPIRSQFATRDLARVELENTMMDGDARCSAIWLAMKDGTRVLFDADDQQDLRAQAQKIGNGLSRPVDVVKDEWPADAPAPE